MALRMIEEQEIERVPVAGQPAVKHYRYRFVKACGCSVKFSAHAKLTTSVERSLQALARHCCTPIATED